MEKTSRFPVQDLTFISAKTRGMRSTLFEKERLAGLMQSKTLPELFGKVFPRGEYNGFSSFQKQLIIDHASQLCRIASFLSEKEKTLFDWMVFRFTLENLKVVFRGWTQKRKEEELLPLVVDTPHLPPVPVSTLLSSSDEGAFIDAIPWEEIKKGAKHGLPFYKKTGKPFFLEAGMDWAYYRELGEILRNLPGRHRIPAEPLIQMERDFFTLLFLLRALFHYKLEKPLVRPFLLPRYGPPLPSWITKVGAAETLKEALGLVPPYFTGPWAPLVTEDLGDFEDLLWSNLYRRANHAFYFSFLTLGSIVAFFYIKRIELTNLIRVSESLRYGRQASEMEKIVLPVSLPGPPGPGT